MNEKTVLDRPAQDEDEETLTQETEIAITEAMIMAGIRALCKYNWQTETEESAVKRIFSAMYRELARSHLDVPALPESDAPKISLLPEG